VPWLCPSWRYVFLPDCWGAWWRGRLKRGVRIEALERCSALVMELFEQMRQLCLRTMACFPLDRLALTAVKRDAGSPKERPGPAEDGPCAADPLQGLWMVWAKSGTRLTLWRERPSPPPPREGARAVVGAWATGAPLVDVPIESKVPHRTRMRGGTSRLVGRGLGTPQRLARQSMDKAS
jgi:hypothetical protein